MDFQERKAAYYAKLEICRQTQEAIREILREASELERNEMLRIETAVSLGLEITASWEEIFAIPIKPEPTNKEEYERSFQEKENNIHTFKIQLGIKDLNDNIEYQRALLTKAKELLIAGTPGDKTDRTLPGITYSIS
ncbi:TPA: hypothetical protein DEP26_05105 [Candidatus Uhrbacteria bacterium]|nr:hypothetical protein [Candidatus Uhrbacteria bacterium]